MPVIDVTWHVELISWVNSTSQPRSRVPSAWQDWNSSPFPGLVKDASQKYKKYRNPPSTSILRVFSCSENKMLNAITLSDTEDKEYYSICAEQYRGIFTSSTFSSRNFLLPGTRSKFKDFEDQKRKIKLKFLFQESWNAIISSVSCIRLDLHSIDKIPWCITWPSLHW